MRYSLRNKDKLVKAFGIDFYRELDESLKHHFRSVVEIQEHAETGHANMFVRVPSVKGKQEFTFAITGKKYDVYNLAYYQIINKQ